MDEDDWASDGGDGGGLGDISDIPTVPVRDLPTSSPANLKSAPTTTSTQQRQQPNVNAWSNASQSGDLRSSLARTRSNPPPRNLSTNSSTTTAPQLFHSVPPGIAHNNNILSNNNNHDNNTNYNNNINNNSINSTNNGMTRQSMSQFKDSQQPQPRQTSPSKDAKGGSIFISNLPFDCAQADIVDFFTTMQVPTLDIRIIRSRDNGGVRAAIVKLMPESSLEKALSLNGSHFNGRPLNVRMDNPDHNRRRHHNSNSQNYDRSSTNFSSGGHPPRSPRMNNNNSNNRNQRQSYRGTNHSNSVPSAAPSDIAIHLPSPVTDGVNPSISLDSPTGGANPSGGGGRNRDRRSNQDQRQRTDNGDRDRNGRSQSRKSVNMGGKDPTIPTGPIPSGRKKLELKPRTKPLPVLDIDKRLIDGPLPKTPSAPPGIPKPPSLNTNNIVPIIKTPTNNDASAHPVNAPKDMESINHEQQQHSSEDLDSEASIQKNPSNQSTHKSIAPTISASTPKATDTNNTATSNAAPGNTVPTSQVENLNPQIITDKSVNGIDVDVKSLSLSNAIEDTNSNGNNIETVNELNNKSSTVIGRLPTQGEISGTDGISSNEGPSTPARRSRGENRPSSERFSSSRRPASERYASINHNYNSNDGNNNNNNFDGNGRWHPSSYRGASKNGRRNQHNNSTLNSNPNKNANVTANSNNNNNNNINNLNADNEAVNSVNNDDRKNINHNNDFISTNNEKRTTNYRTERSSRPSRFGYAEKKDDNPRKSFKSINPFDALMDDVDSDDKDM